MSLYRYRRVLLGVALFLATLYLFGNTYALAISAPYYGLRSLWSRNIFCGCSGGDAVFVRADRSCPKGLLAEDSSRLTPAPRYHGVVPRDTTPSTNASIASATTGSPGMKMSTVVGGLAASCSGTAASCTTSYVYSWMMGQENSASLPSSTSQSDSLTISTSYSTSVSSNFPASTSPPVAALTVMTGGSTVSSGTGTTVASGSTSTTSVTSVTTPKPSGGCYHNSGVSSSWTTSATFEENLGFVISTWVAGVVGTSTVPLCDLGEATWLPVASTSPPSFASSAISSAPNPAITPPNFLTTTLTAGQGTATVVFVEDVVFNNSVTQILTQISASTLSLNGSTVLFPNTTSTGTFVPSPALPSTTITISSTTTSTVTVPASPSSTPSASTAQITTTFSTVTITVTTTANVRQNHGFSGNTTRISSNSTTTQPLLTSKPSNSSANTQWSPLGSISSTTLTVTMSDVGVGEVVVAVESVAITSINPTFTATQKLGVSPISTSTWNGSQLIDPVNTQRDLLSPTLHESDRPSLDNKQAQSLTLFPCIEPCQASSTTPASTSMEVPQPSNPYVPEKNAAGTVNKHVKWCHWFFNCLHGLL